jgi:hypothetical protein
MNVYKVWFMRTEVEDGSCTVAPLVTLAAEDEDAARKEAIERIANSDKYTFQAQPEVGLVTDVTSLYPIEWNLDNSECEIGRYAPEIECHRLAKHIWGHGSLISVCDVHVHEDPMMGTNIDAEIAAP